VSACKLILYYLAAMNILAAGALVVWLWYPRRKR
jgi:hypothetical protein